MAKPKICFIHIPRTAGTSLMTYLGGLYGKKHLCPYTDQEQYYDSNPVDKYLLFGGHTNFRVRKILGRDVKYITMFGEPINRSISHIVHMQNNRELPDLPIGQILNRDDFVEKNIKDYQIRRLVPDYKSMTRQEAYVEAIFRLDKFDFFGIKEYYYASVVKMLEKFDIDRGIKNPSPGVYRGKSATLGLEDLRKLKQLVYWDTELYNYTKDQFLRNL